jgi:hypothetical protein
MKVRFWEGTEMLSFPSLADRLLDLSILQISGSQWLPLAIKGPGLVIVHGAFSYE